MSRLEQLADTVQSNKLMFLLAGLVIGSTVSYLALEYGRISGESAAQQLVSTLEAQTGQNLEVVSVERKNGLYKVDISNSQNQLSTYYVTENGRLVTNGMTDLQQLRTTIAAQRDFSQCIAESNTVLYGNRSQQATALQIQVLGGSNMVSEYYRDVNNPNVLQQAAQRGVQRVPSFYRNGSTLGGVNQIDQISQFTGCSFGQ